METATAADQMRHWNREHLSAGRASINEFFGDEFEVGSHGNVVTTDRGRNLINLAGYGVNLLGGLHPRVKAAVQDQLDRAGMASRVICDSLQPAAAHELAGTFLSSDLQKVHCANSGAEAVEAAIKLARAQGVRRMITTKGGFHGKTIGALSLTNNRTYQDPFLPLLPDVTVVPYGDATAIRSELASRDERAVVFLEPIQGEAGVKIPPTGYLAEVSSACRDYDALLVMDEIQTGLGRTGRMWAHEAENGCRPEIVLVGKVLSGGLVPVSALVATSEVYAPFDRDPFVHSSTFAGNPLAMAAAIETIRVIRDDDLPARCAAVGADLLNRLHPLVQRFPMHLQDLRGRGCLLALELNDEGTAGELLLGLLDRGILVNHSLNSGSVVRLTPSAYLEPSEVGQTVAAITNALEGISTLR